MNSSTGERALGCFGFHDDSSDDNSFEAKLAKAFSKRRPNRLGTMVHRRILQIQQEESFFRFRNFSLGMNGLKAHHSPEASVEINNWFLINPCRVAS
jgi:hypothetical protein